MKDIEWLKEEIGELPCVDAVFNSDGSSYIDSAVPVMAVYDLIDELDEAETLSEEWIDDNSFEADNWNEVVHVVQLKNLLVPKQEERVSKADELKPTVPQFVADWIDVAKSRHHTLLQAVDRYAPEDIKEWLWKYFNSDLFGEAWLAYPNIEVEKKQKYILSINITDKASKTNYETFLNKRGIFHSMENESFNSEEFNWTEEEIKDLESGEILFEHFATKVKELEE